MLGDQDAIWEDGEWISWNDTHAQVQHQEWSNKYPNADQSLIPYFEHLLALAENYFRTTGKHLQLYGVIGELFGAITHGIKLHKNYAQGSDGRIGNDFVEIKTIGPTSASKVVTVKRSGHFSKLYIVRINENFELSGRLIDRQDLPNGNGKIIRVKWPF